MTQFDLTQTPFQVGDWQVYPQLNRVTCNGDTVTLVPKMMTMLVFIAQNSGQMITREELFAHVWKGQIVGDNAVYHQIAQLRKLFKDSANNPDYIETIPKKGYRLIATVSIFEVTKPQAQIEILAVPIAEEPQPKATPFSFRIYITAAVLILFFIGHQFFENSNQITHPEQVVTKRFDSIAVLPFKKLGNGQEQQYFAEGLTETLQHQLSQLRGLRVSSRTSSFEFENSQQNFQTIGNKLGVAALLTGSIQSSSDMQRIIIQLINVQDGSHLWSKTFDYTDQNMFAIHDTIGQSVASALRLKLNRNNLPVAVTINKKAHDNYLRGRYHLNRPSSTSLEHALKYFNEAIEQDPQFALAYVGLSDSYLSMPKYAGSDHNKSISKAEAAINHALIINPLLGEAHASLAGIKFSQGQLLAAEASYKKAIELAPNYTNSYFKYGGLLNHQGRYEEAYQMNKKAIILDPLSIAANYDLAWIMFELGLFSEAEQQLQHAFELMPDGPTKYLQQNWSNGVDFDYLKDFINWFQLNASKLDEVPSNSSSFALIGQLWLNLGEIDKARYWITKAQTVAPTKYFTYYSLAVLATVERKNENVRDYYRLMQKITPSNKLSTLYNAFAEIWMQNYPTAQVLLLEVFPEFELLDKVRINDNNYLALVRFAKTLQETDKNQEAQKLLVRLGEYFQNNPVDHSSLIELSDVETYAMLNDSEKAIGLLTQAIDLGWMPNYYKLKVSLERNPMFSNLDTLPEFQNLIDKIHQRQKEILSLVKQ